MMSDPRFFPSPAFSFAMNQYRAGTVALDFFHNQRQRKIKVEPEVTFYGCLPPERGNSNSSSGSPMSDKSSPLALECEESVEGISASNGSPKPPRPQACKVCGKVLSSASSYYVHMKLHSGNKPYQCTFCEASFCRKPYLEVHMRTHTGERPFQCEMCNKRFTQKSSLNTHKRVHTGERPYSCDICQKRFAVKSYVAAHRWSHVAEKPPSCDHCSMTFTNRAQYAIHMRTHATSPAYDCHLCGRSFARDSYLIRHHNRVHRDMFPPIPDYDQVGCDMRSVWQERYSHMSQCILQSLLLLHGQTSDDTH